MVQSSALRSYLFSEGNNGNHPQNNVLQQHGNGVRGSKLDSYHHGFYQHGENELEGLERSKYKYDTANLEPRQNQFHGNHVLQQHGNGNQGSKFDRYHYGFYHHGNYDLEGLEKSKYKDDAKNLDDAHGYDFGYNPKPEKK